jgi:hypothetical protein
MPSAHNAQVAPDVGRGVDRLGHTADLAGSIRGCVDAAVAGAELETKRLDSDRGDVAKLLQAQAPFAGGTRSPT